MKKLLLLLLFPIFSFSQTNKEIEKIKEKTNAKILSDFISKEKIKNQKDKENVLKYSALFNWPKTIKKDSTFSELIRVTDDLKPVYFSTYNNGAGVTSRANKLYTGGGLGLNIHGENMRAGVWDAGSGMPSHELFTGRLQLMDASPSTHYHSAHVAGTIIGSELFQGGQAKGMAYKGFVNSYDWTNDTAEVATAASNGLLISNHSYGYNPNGVQAYQWGKYDSDSMAFDEIMFNAPYYQFVCAAGNSRGNFNLTKNGFDLLTGHAAGKNSIVVAAVNQVNNYTGPSSVVMSSFSSWGPTDDGRIKPDISAKGVSTFSAMDDSNSSYDNLSGTSMASPSVAGTLLLYQQYYNQLNGNYMKASTLRGLMIHSADEAGTGPGPDYKFGWGLINAEKAADIITKKSTYQAYILENNLTQNQTFNLTVNSNGTEPLVATLCWTDPKGTIPSQTIDDSTPNLVNDLDIRITKASTVNYPWKLDPANPNNPAITGDNLVDNVEKTEINNPIGSYIVSITHKGTLTNSNQNYSLIISGVNVNDFWLTSNSYNQDTCQGTNTIQIPLNLFTKSDFNGTINFSTINLPGSLSTSFSPTTMTAAGLVNLQINNLNSLSPGVYPFTAIASYNGTSFELPLQITILSSSINNVVLTSPLNNSNSISIPATLNWTANPNTTDYELQIATDSSFSNIVINTTVNTNSFDATTLNYSTTYYWRVRPSNICGIGNYSASFNFTTECLKPNNVALLLAGTNTATLTWTEISGSTSWEYIVVPQGVTPGTSGTITTTNPLTITGLTTNTCYDFYVRSLCSVGNSGWTTLFNFCTQPNYCGGDHFYDTGGASGSYQNNENYTKTIYPDVNGNRVRAVFNSFQLESCCDYLRIYNGPNNTFPLLFSGSSSPGTISSTHSTGALTFTFSSDGSIVDSGWDATIYCEPLPACPLEPNNIIASAITTNSATIAWAENSGSTSWEYIVVPQGTTPGASGTITTTNPLTITGLATNTCYDFYVRSICTNGTSAWSNFFRFCTQPNYCGGDHFYDTGGASGSYQDYENYTKTIYPDVNGNRVRAVFNSFQLESCCDYLRIYNGPNNTFPLLFNGSSSPGTISSTHSTGALTFTFSSDGSVVGSGWDATIYCEPMPACPLPPNNINGSGFTTNGATITWTENSGSTSWEYIVVPQGTTPGASGTITTTNPLTITGLATNTCYDFYVRSICTNGTSAWSNFFRFCTQPNYCGGDHFYDTGGASGSYQNGENYAKTIYPDVNGNRVRAVFNSFQLESCCDYLRIYNGPNNTFPLLFSGSSSPGTVSSTHSTGALTFTFSSDSSVVGSGWDATIYCEPMPACPLPPNNINGSGFTSNGATITWTENSGSTSWEYIVVPQGTTPGASGIITTTNPLTITGLATNTCYDFYVRSICTNGTSAWSNFFRFCTQPNYCGGDHFYDTGGASGSYQNGENYAKTIYPNVNGNRVRAVFNSFQLESCCDYLRIYNGPNNTFPLLFSGNGTNSPGTVSSTHASGALTFTFSSDGSVVGSGWDATIYCEPMPACPLPPNNVIGSAITTNSATITWTENSGSTSWEYIVVPQGTTPGASGIITTTKPLTITGLAANTCYDFYVRSICANGTSAWSNFFRFCTQPNYCGGDHFYDTGGVSGFYQNGENYSRTIYPQVPGDFVNISFNSFQTESCCDYLRIYNGPNNTYPLLFSGSGSILPGAFTSTDTSGALTINFSSDSSVIAEGWDATINCQLLSTKDNYLLSKIKFYPNPFESNINISSVNRIKKYTVYDVNLRLIKSDNVGNNEFSIDLSQFSSGLYFIKLEDEYENTYDIKASKK